MQFCCGSSHQLCIVIVLHRKTKKFLQNFADSYFKNGLRDVIQIWNVHGLPDIEANCTVTLVPFGEDITELWMCENHDFVIPVNILTPFAHALFCWVPRHTTMCFDSLHLMFYHI